jgi:hypothetical protein
MRSAPGSIYSFFPEFLKETTSSRDTPDTSPSGAAG